MGHSRIKMELIKKESTRIHTFQKRKNSLVKKVSEFSILCGVEACLIIFGPKQKGQQAKLEATWPSNPYEFRRTVNKFKKTNHSRRCYLVSDYFADKKKKIDVEISKLHRQIQQAKYPWWDVRLNNFSDDQLRVLLAQLDDKLERVNQKLYTFQENQNLMDRFASSVLYGSQYVTKINNIGSRTNLQLFSNVQSLNVPLPTSFQPVHSSYTNWMEGNSIYDCSTNLQVFSDYHTAMTSQNLMDPNNENNNLDNWQLQLCFDPKPIDIQLPMHFQHKQSSQGSILNVNIMENEMRKVSNDRNVGNQVVGRRIISNNPSLYVNPSSWMWNNAMLNSSSIEDASMSNVGSNKQTMLPEVQLPTSSFIDDEICPSQGQQGQFNCDIEHEKKGENWK